MSSTFQDLQKRLFTGVFCIIIVLFLIGFSNTLIGFCVFGIFISFFALIASYEYIQITNKKNIQIPLFLFSSFVVLEVILFFLAAKFLNLYNLPLSLFFAFIMLFFLYLFFKNNLCLNTVTAFTFGLLYIAMPLGILAFIVYPKHLYINIYDGRFLLIYLLVTTKITDIAGYFFGKSFGVKRLCSKVSPNKTIVGTVAGIFFSTITSICFFYLAKILKTHNFPFTLATSVILGILMGVVGQMGDLCESLLKRDANIKDSNTIPGLGGMLDMLDSLLFTIPLLYFFLN
jgi:phosphatidate cytidylyltransferase